MNKRHGCSCEKCRALCHHEAGWFAPEEIEAAADFMKMNYWEFVATYLKEVVEEGVRVLAPRMEKRATRCIFLQKGLCSIHEVKPFECRKVYGCEATRRHKRIRDTILKMWQKKG